MSKPLTKKSTYYAVPKGFSFGVYPLINRENNPKEQLFFSLRKYKTERHFFFVKKSN